MSQSTQTMGTQIGQFGFNLGFPFAVKNLCSDPIKWVRNSTGCYPPEFDLVLVCFKGAWLNFFACKSYSSSLELCSKKSKLLNSALKDERLSAAEWREGKTYGVWQLLGKAIIHVSIHLSIISAFAPPAKIQGIKISFSETWSYKYVWKCENAYTAYFTDKINTHSTYRHIALTKTKHPTLTTQPTTKPPTHPPL